VENGGNAIGWGRDRRQLADVRRRARPAGGREARARWRRAGEGGRGNCCSLLGVHDSGPLDLKGACVWADWIPTFSM
jgi:hypothetical protein